MIHFDELDKAHPSFLTTIMNFVEDGELTSANGVKFKLPEETKLIIVFTANYAANELLDKKSYSSTITAKEVIKNDMRINYGISESVLGRISFCFPFFKLEDDVLDTLCASKVRNSFQNLSTINQHIDCIVCDEETSKIINSIIQIQTKSNPTQGLRNLSANV